MKLHEDGKGAAIVGERSILNARIQYPEKVSPYYSNLFSGPDLVDYKPTDAYPQSGHERIWWETDRVKSTKIVSTISVDDINGTSAYVKTTNGENFMKLEFENGTVAYVNLSTEPDSKVIADNVEFIGTAVVLNEKDIMLVGGTSLTVGGKMIVESDRLTTVSIANNTLTVSSNDDFNVSVGTKNKYIDGITSIKERDGSELSKLKGNVLISDTKMAEQLLNKEDKTMFNGVASIADSDIVEPDFNAEKINISADKGYYSYLLNDQVLPGHKTGNKLTFDLIIDGVKKNFEGEAFLDHDYKESAYIKGVKLDNHRYKLVGKSKNLEFMDGFINVNNGNVVFDGVYNFKVKGEGNYLELEINDPKKVTSAVYEDAESWKNNTAVFIEAESFISSTGSSKFTVDFKDFASGGKTIRDVDIEKDTVTYSFNVSENGVYDFVMCIASWVTPSPNLTIVLDGEEMTIPLQFTGGWGGNKQADFDAIISDINCSLKTLYRDW